MKLHLKKTTTLLNIGIAVGGFFVILAIVIASLAGKSVAAESQGGRLITVHDRGQQLTFITDKTTLREALQAAEIAIDPRDAVEPSLDENLVASNYQVNVYRARPVTIVDGALRLKVVTPYQSPARIVEDAGITLHAEDTTTITRSNDIVSDGAGLQLVIDRATEITVDFYGSVSKLRTQAATVGDFLKEKNISLGTNGRASANANAAITQGMALRIWREGKQTISVDESVAYSVKQVKDADQPTSYKKVETAGVAGTRAATYEIEVVNGQEVSRVEIASITTKEPIQQVEIVGAKPTSIPYTGGGSKTDWLAASSIPQESWGYADFMVQKESGWNPNAVNRSSGACGLAQALPCSKLGADWSNPVVALNWMNGYVNGRYYDGSPYAHGLCSGITDRWQCAYTFWQVKRWY